MIGINYFKENKDKILESLKRRGMDPKLGDSLSELLQKRGELLLRVEEKRREINEKTPKSAPDENTKQLLRDLSEETKKIDEDLKTAEVELGSLLGKLPNLVSPESPEGGEEDFKEIKKWGEIPNIQNPKDHEEIGKNLDLIDFESGTKVSGAKFYYLKNEAVMLEFALVSYVMKLLVAEGFVPMITPQIVKNEVLEGIGFAPKGPEKQVYGIEGEEMSLIGTAEVTLGGYHKDEVIDEKRLPIKYAGFSTCFRTEAGAYGKHSKGLYRVHQFDKVEMFIICMPGESERMHLYLVDLEEKIFQGLGLPYRVIEIAAGDLGAPAYRKFDVEVWMPGRGDYGEVTSTSNTTNHQAIRLNIKFTKDQDREYVHTLNGTAVAISRAMIAILENYQQADGSVKVPEALIPYTGFTEIKSK